MLILMGLQKNHINAADMHAMKKQLILADAPDISAVPEMRKLQTRRSNCGVVFLSFWEKQRKKILFSEGPDPCLSKVPDVVCS